MAAAPSVRVLIPGCGSAYEVAAFHAAGWRVTALDFSPMAVDSTKALLGALGECVILGDFFSHPFEESSFDLVYERTFLCALPPHLWVKYAARMRRLIRPGGKLAGFFFYGKEPEPPPYPLTNSLALKLMGNHFACTHDEPVDDSLAIYAGCERWQEWIRKPA